MEQNTQPIENNNEVKLDSEGEPINQNLKKGSNKKVVVLILFVVLLVLASSIYFVFFNKEGDSQLVPEANVEVFKDEEVVEVIETEIDRKLDTDQDGLPDYLEKILGTDENKSDTDGDSYDDFNEIKNGYNPLSMEKYTEEEWEEVKEIIGKEGKVIFRDMLITSDEVVQRAVVVCQKMEDEDQKNLCLALTKNDSSECESQPEILKEGCYLFYAILDNNSSLCEKSLDNGLCLATILKDESKCELSSDVETCYSSVSVAKKDIAVCKKFKDEDMQNFCIAPIEKDIKYCKKIEDGNIFKDMCFMYLAKGKNDVLICSELKPDKQNDCMAFVNKDKDKINCRELFSNMYCTLLGTETMDDSYCDLIKIESEVDNSFNEYYYKSKRDHCRITIVGQILSTIK